MEVLLTHCADFEDIQVILTGKVTVVRHYDFHHFLIRKRYMFRCILQRRVMLVQQ